MTSAALASLRADAVSDWEPCAETFYCQEHLYDLSWQDVDLDVQRVAAAPFGGPLALMRDESALTVVRSGAPGGRPVVRVFSCSGQLLGSFLWEGAKLAGCGWSSELELVMVDVAGKVVFYTVSGARSPKQVLVAVRETVWVVDDHGATDQPLPAGCGGVAAMAVAPNGAFVALACNDGRLRVMTSDFSQQLSEFDSRSGVPPACVAWCGVDAVALRWEGLLLLVGPYGDWLKRPCQGAVAMVTEVDGLRLISSGTCSLLRRVPDALVQVFKPGSTSPAAQLLDARDLYDAGSARSDKLLRQMAGHLAEAVEGCAAAAGLDLSITRQRALLRAAVFGRAFAPSVAAPLLRDTAQRLRLLNALREPAVGLPLTMPQLQALSLPVVINRLVLLRQHLLAYRIAEAMGGGGQQEVLLHWAAAKISASPAVPDFALKEALAAKMSKLERPKYAPLAAHAQSVGRRSLAIRLLEEEPSAAQQVPLLLSLAKTAGSSSSGSAGAAGPGLDEAGGPDDTLGRALLKAIVSGDPDLVYLVLFEAYRSRPLPDFWKLVSPRVTARKLFVKFTRLKEPELLETLYVTQQLHQEAADLALESALRHLVPHSAAAAARPEEAEVARAVSGLQAAAQKYTHCRDAAWQSKATAEAAMLLKEQSKLERDTGQSLFVGLSLADSIATCLRMGHNKAAASLRRRHTPVLRARAVTRRNPSWACIKFAVPEVRWYWVKLGALAAAHDWEGLDAWAGERKSPIGWEPFLQAAQKNGAPREVQARLIARMPDSRAKADAYEAVSCPREAAEVAAKLKDSDLLARIQGAVSANSSAGIAIAQIRERLQGR
ncbi:vacuolar protein sorting-associated protein 16 [Scenedesmus sp. NREL 46B-D3]|nr:vacuolar protein sorting-associated protein 16 [Scenedesmus sp. NREL 46B-D3]